MHRFVGLAVTLLSAVFALPAAGSTWVPVQPGEVGAPPTVVVERSSGLVRIEIAIAGLWAEELTLDERSFTALTVPELGLKGQEGTPYLPFRSVLVPVPAGPEVGAPALTEEAPVTLLTGVEVQPAQPPRPDCGVHPVGELRFDDTVYGTDAWLPSEPVRLVEEIVVRGQRFLSLEVSPVRYNPARGEVAASPRMVVEVALEGPVDEAAENLKRRRGKPFFDVSGEGTPAGPESNPTGFEYLIVTHDSFLAAVEPLAEWKRLKGFTVDVVPTSSVGSTSSAVKAFLQTRYDSDPDLTFVLLVGDHQQIPAENVGGFVSDLYYSCLDGSDYFPDVLLGRISVQTATDAANAVSKIVGYERTPDSGTWHGDFLMAALLQDYNDYNCRADRWFFETGTHVMHYVRDVLGMGILTAATSDSLSCNPYRWRTDSYPHRFSGYAGGSVPADDAALITHGTTATADVIAAINAGVAIVQHRDHGSTTGWGDPHFSVSHVNSLANESRLPVVFSINCSTGTFNASSDCFAEALQKKHPGGAVGVVASTETSYSGYNDLISHGTYDCFWNDYDPADGGNIYPNSFRPAAALNYGKYYMYTWEGASSYTQIEVEMFHWFGDPEMEIITAPPAPVSVIPSCPLAVGATTLDLTSDAEGATVAVTQGGVLLGRAVVGGGSASVALDPPPAAPGELTVVVTGRNLQPWEGTCQVIVPDGPWLAYRDHGVDDAAGNGDGVVNPGETVVMAVTVENIGTETGTGLVGTLSTSSADANVTDPVAAFPDMAVGGLAQTLPDHVAFTVDPAAVNGAVVPFTLDWTADGGWAGAAAFGVPICEALVVSDLSIDEITDTEAVVTWTTNLPATSEVRYGTSSPAILVEDTLPRTSHAVTLTELSPCTGYVLEVGSSSEGCYQVTDDNGGAWYGFATVGRVTAFADDAESGNIGWTAQSPWAITSEAASSPTHSWSDSPGGSYGNYVDASLTSPVIDLSGMGAAELTFRHIYEIESGWDYGYVEVTTNGSSWTALAAYDGELSTWTEEVFDLTPYVGSATFQVRFRLDTDGSVTYDGWHVDDIRISTLTGCETPLFADGFESGDTGAWSTVAP
mgnify:FL=1